AHRDVEQLAVRRREGFTGHGCSHSLEGGPRGVAAHPLEHDADLLAAVTRGPVAGPQAFPDPGRCAGEDLVAARPAVGLVDAPEVVDVEQPDRERPAVFAGALEL